MKTLLRVIARRLGLGCWCCGRYGQDVMFYWWHPIMRVTWCSECKFAACEYCCDDVPTGRNLWRRAREVSHDS